MELNKNLWENANELLVSLDINLVMTVFVILIFGYFLYHLVEMYRSTNTIEKDLKDVNNLMEQCIGKDRNQFYSRMVTEFDKINSKLESNASLKHKWHEFKEHIIFLSDEESSQSDTNTLKIKNSIQPDFFFHEEVFLEGTNADLRYLDSIPGKLTSLGILGTFIGLSIGIAGAMVDVSGNAITIESLIPLLKGASLAFMTSVLGVFLTIIFSHIEKRKIKSIRIELKKFVDYLEKSFKLITTEQIISEVHLSIQEQNKKFDGFSNELAVAIGNTLKDPLTKGISQIVDGMSSLKSAQQNISNDLIGQLSEKLSGGLSSQVQKAQEQAGQTLHNIQGIFQDQSQHIITSQNEMMEKTNQMMANISHTIQEQQKFMKHQSEKSAHHLASSQEQIIATTKQMVSDIINATESQQKNLMEQTQDSTHQLIASQDKFVHLQNDVHTKAKENIAELFKASQDQQKYIAEQTTNSARHFVQSQNKMIEKTNQMITNISETIQEQRHQITDQNKKSTESFIKSAQEVLFEFSKASQDQQIQFKNQIAKHLEVFSTMVEKIKEASYTLIPLLKQLHNNLDQNKNITEDNKHLIEKQKELIAHFKDCSNQISRSSQELNQAGDSIMEASKFIKEIPHQMQETNRNLEAVWSDYQSRFEGVDEKLIRTFNIFKDGASTYQNAVDEHVKNITAEYSKAINILADQLEELSDILDIRKNKDYAA